MAERFGAYILRERIGVGGMAEVFWASLTGVEGFEKDLVIKRILPHFSDNPSFVGMFLSEAKLAALLSHPNIVQIYDLGKIGDSYFLAMEYVAGRDLSDIMAKTQQLGIPIPIEYVAKIGSSACEALHYAHTKTDARGTPLHIVHRDVSPENIRIAWTGSIKLLDFGIAKAATRPHEAHKTRVGEIKGKVAFMSPEQILGQDLDRRSDLFALGAVLYECLTGVRLFAGANPMEVMDKVLDERIYLPSYFRDDIAAPVEAIVMKAVERDRDRRYSSAIDMQYDLDAFLASREFIPSSLHLSNFVKQIFRDEVDVDQQRRVTDGNAPGPAVVPEARAVPPMPRFAGGEVDAHMDMSRGAAWSHQTGDGVRVPLDDMDLRRLERLAARHSMTTGQLLTDIVSHYLKYHDVDG